MNLRTLGRLLVLGNLIFVGWLVHVFFAYKFSLPASLGPLLFVTGILGAVAGSVGLLLVFKRKIAPKCPRCDSVMEFHEDQQLRGLRHLRADCPRCGCVEFSFRRLTGIRIDRVTPHGAKPRYDAELDVEVHDDEEEEISESKYSFVGRHAKGLMLFLSPVAVSIIWASLHHRFTFAYLFPAIWCTAVACILLAQWESGRINWKGGGVTLRSKNPVAFWGHSLVWLLFYAFAAYFPIGYARQERAKDEKREIESASPASKKPAAPASTPPAR